LAQLGKKNPNPTELASKSEGEEEKRKKGKRWPIQTDNKHISSFHIEQISNWT